MSLQKNSWTACRSHNSDNSDVERENFALLLHYKGFSFLYFCMMFVDKKKGKKILPSFF